MFVRAKRVVFNTRKCADKVNWLGQNHWGERRIRDALPLMSGEFFVENKNISSQEQHSSWERRGVVARARYERVVCEKIRKAPPSRLGRCGSAPPTAGQLPPAVSGDAAQVPPNTRGSAEPGDFPRGSVSSSRRRAGVSETAVSSIIPAHTR